MKFIFFENPSNPEKVAFTVSDKSPEALEKEGIIPDKNKTLSIDYVEPKDMDMELFLTVYNIGSVKFDSKSKPTKLVVNSNVAAVEHLEYIRTLRKGALSTLDGIQMRFLAKGDAEGVNLVEKDKQRLRDTPAKLKLSRIKSLVELHHKIPVELLVDYEEKYKERLSAIVGQ